MDGGEGNWEQTRVAHVIHAYDLDVFRDADSEGEQNLHQAGSGQVVGADDCVRPGYVEHSANERFILGTSAPYRLPLGLDRMGAKRLVETSDAGVHGVGCEFRTEEDHATCAP